MSLLRFAIFFSICLGLCSCASIVNGRKTLVMVHTDKPMSIIHSDSTYTTVDNFAMLRVKRSKNPMALRFESDALVKDTLIKSKNSFVFWCNFGIAYGAGMLIDLTNQKRFTYPKNIYFSMNDINAFRDSMKFSLRKEIREEKYSSAQPAPHQNSVKISPLKYLDFSNPAMEIVYERKLNDVFSTQAMASYLFGSSIWNLSNDEKPLAKGFRVALEQRYYHKRNALKGSYFAFELNYLKNRYDGYWEYVPTDLWGINNIGLVPTREKFTIHKQMTTCHFKWGYQKLGRFFCYDFFVGAGIRYKDVRHVGKNNSPDIRGANDWFDGQLLRNRDGNSWWPSMTLGVCIGHYF